MKHKHGIIKNLPKNPKEIYDRALEKCYKHWVDEKYSTKNPGYARVLSEVGYEEAFELIENFHPHWVISFRNESYISEDYKDHWEFGGCNIQNSDKGTLFIWILVDVDVAERIFEEFDLEINWY